MRAHLFAQLEPCEGVFAVRRRGLSLPSMPRLVDAQKIVLEAVIQRRLLLQPRLQRLIVRHDRLVCGGQFIVRDAESSDLVLHLAVLRHQEVLERLAALQVGLVGVRVGQSHEGLVAIAVKLVVHVVEVHARKLDILF